MKNLILKYREYYYSDEGAWLDTFYLFTSIVLKYGFLFWFASWFSVVVVNEYMNIVVTNYLPQWCSLIK